MHRRRLTGIVRINKMDVPSAFAESEERARPPRAPPMPLLWHWSILIGSFELTHAYFSLNGQVRPYHDDSPVLHIRDAELCYTLRTDATSVPL